MRVLITGASGTIGRQLARHLSAEHELVLGDLRPSGESGYCHVDVTDLASLEAAMKGVEAVVHLAVASGHEGEYENDAFNQLRFDVNVKGTWNALEAARRQGVRRFVHTSSLMVVWGYPPPQQVAADAAARPVGTYAQTKHLAEILCQQAHLASGLSIVCMRIAKPVDIDNRDDAARLRPLRPQWLAFPDLVEAYRLALAAPSIGFEIVTVVGEGRYRRWDLDKAHRLLGYSPRCDLEQLGFTIAAEQPDDYVGRQ